MSAPATHVLVTGGAGFIGSHVVDDLVTAGVRVTVLDNLDRAAHAVRPDYLNPDVHYVWADARDPDAWRRSLNGVDAVCHQAGKVGLGVDFGDVTDYVQHNDVAMAAGLVVLHERHFDGRLVLASSMVVYGEGRYRCPDHGVVRPGPRRVTDLDAGRFEPPCPHCGAALEPEPIPETAPLEPRNVYAATKLHQEHLVAAFAREHVVDCTALRYHNVFGARMPRDTPYAGVASILRSALENGAPPQVTEDGRQLRDFVHVLDVASANVLALTGPPRPCVFNIGSGHPHSVGEMAQALASALGSEPGDERWPVITGGYRLGDVRHVYALTDAARNDLGFVASVDFTAGMRSFATATLRQRTVTNSGELPT